jgi:hypothetical protein
VIFTIFLARFLSKGFLTVGTHAIDKTHKRNSKPGKVSLYKNPYYFPDGMGNNGSDFTVGAVLLKKGMGNFFKGQIGGLAVFNRALTDEEMKSLN